MVCSSSLWTNFIYASLLPSNFCQGVSQDVTVVTAYWGNRTHKRFAGANEWRKGSRERGGIGGEGCVKGGMEWTKKWKDNTYGMIFVGSYAPPIPASITATSTWNTTKHLIHLYSKIWYNICICSMYYVHTFKPYNQYKPFLGERYGTPLQWETGRILAWFPRIVPMMPIMHLFPCIWLSTKLLSCLHTFVELNLLWQSQKWETNCVLESGKPLIRILSLTSSIWGDLVRVWEWILWQGEWGENVWE